MNPRPLEGITVIALEHAIAAPFATRQLADMGARVIKIERPGVGDFARAYDARVAGLCSHFAWVNRSKESLALDLKDAAAREVLARLLERADVLIQNLAPGATARMGLDYASLKERHPRLIVCDISGYGGDGPQRDKKAYDLLIQSEAGFLSTTGTPEEPAKAGISIADIAAGMYAYTGILNALMLREKTGTGSAIDVSMLESLAEWMSFPLYYAYQGASPPPRAGASHATIYPYGPFRAGDGKRVVLGLQNEREWAAFCAEVLRDPALAGDMLFDSVAKRSANREALRAIIEAAFEPLSTAEVEARLDAAGIGYGRMNDMAGLWAHPQLAARKRWREVESPVGPIPALLPPGTSSAFEARMDPVPALGAHTEAILREIGCDAACIARLT
ncbi:MAG: CoA transferase [Burkholderiales bacterium]|nr:CoA transferase [Burkholderiales bacterium]